MARPEQTFGRKKERQVQEAAYCYIKKKEPSYKPLPSFITLWSDCRKWNGVTMVWK